MKKNSAFARLTPDATLSQITNADRRAGELLSSIGLKPDSHKNQTLRSVCQQRQWSETEVLKWLKNHRKSSNGKSSGEEGGDSAFGNDLSRWCEYMEEEFHTPNLALLREIRAGLPRVHQIHGNQYVWLKNMQWHFDRFDEALRMYYKFEAEKFHRLVKRVHQAKGDLLDGTIRSLERSADIIEKDQHRLQRFKKTLSKHSNGFESPEGACSTLHILNQNFKILFSSLDTQFEIERTTLLPAARKLTTVK